MRMKKGKRTCNWIRSRYLKALIQSAKLPDTTSIFTFFSLSLDMMSIKFARYILVFFYAYSCSEWYVLIEYWGIHRIHTIYKKKNCNTEQTLYSCKMFVFVSLFFLFFLLLILRSWRSKIWVNGKKKTVKFGFSLKINLLRTYMSINNFFLIKLNSYPKKKKNTKKYIDFFSFLRILLLLS